MTFYELYQQYLNKYTAPQQGIMSIQPVTPVGESGGDGSPSPGMTAGPTGAIGFSDAFGNISALDVALGLMNPVGLAVSLGARAVGLPSLQDIGKMAMNAVGFGDSSSTGTANATDTGDMGSEAANNAATAAANAAAAAAGGDSSGGGADGGGPGGGDSGDTGGPFRDGGRATLYDGGSAFDNYNAPEYIPSEDKNLSDYFNANVNYSTGESNPMNDVNVGTTNLQAIMNANIPIDDQFSLLGRLGYFKDRASVTYKDYPEEIYEGSSKDRALGLGYYNNGLSASGMYNVDTKSPELRLDYTTKFANGGRIGYAEGSSNLSREEIINRILQEIKPGFESAREVYPDYYSTGLDVDYLKTLDPDEIKQALDRAYLQGEGFQNADFTSGRIGQGSPFFRYSPEYMKKVNYNNPLQISNSNTAYNLRNQLNELESILGKKNIEAYKTTLDDSLIDYYKNRFTADLDLQKKLFGEQTTPTVAEQIISPDDAMNQYDISNQMDEVTGVGSGALTAGSLLPKYIDDFQYAAPPGTDIDQVRNLARQTASDKSITALIKDVYNDPAKFDPNFKPKAGQIKTGYPQYLKEGILSATGFQPTSQIGGGTDAARAFLEKIKSVPGAQFLGKVLPGVGTASGVYDVGSRLSQGDYVGAGLGALSAIPFVGIPAAAAQAAYDYRGPLIEKATNFFNKLQSAPSNVTEHINTAVGSLNPFQQQQYVNYAIQNPDQAITAAQQNKDFLAATQKNIAPAPASMANGGRVFYLQGGLASLLG
jgi:hypothetical protein